MDKAIFHFGESKGINQLQLILATPLVESYRYIFPNSEFTILKVACLVGKEFAKLQTVISGSVIHVEQVTNWESWLQFIAIRKRLHQIGIAQGIDLSILNGFDVVKCQSQSKLIGIYSNEITSALSTIVRESNSPFFEKRRIIDNYKRTMNDLQEHQIGIGGQITVESLRVGFEFDRILIRANHSFIVRPESWVQQQYNSSLRQCPYEKDVKIMQNLIQEVYSKQKQESKEIISRTSMTPHLNQIIDFTFLLDEFSRKSFNEIPKSGNYKKILSNNQFLQDLFKHFIIEGNIQNASQLISFRKTLLIQRAKQNPKELQYLDNCLKVQQNVKIEEKLYQIPSKSYVESLKKLYYNPLQLPFNQRTNSLVTIEDLEKTSKNIRPINKFSMCQFHFLKAKQAWLNLNFFRALGHLSRSQEFAPSPIILSRIYQEKGRIFSHLCEYQKSEQYYLNSLILREQLEGNQSIQLLSVLENLMILYSKMYRNDKIDAFQVRCETIKKRNNYRHLRLMPNLVYCDSIQMVFNSGNNGLDSPSKASKLISKEDIVKMQIERIPALGKTWQIVKPFFEKGEKVERKNLQINPNVFEFGQFNQLYCILKLISSMSNEIPLQNYQRERILLAIEEVSHSNLRMYYRLIFLMSYYCQSQQELILAIDYMLILINTPLCIFSITIYSSFRKRLLELAKKVGLTAQIRKIYTDIDWMSNEGMMEELYNSALFFQKEKSHLLCIKSCKRYLKQYSSFLDINNKKNKTVDHSQQLLMVLSSQLIQLHLFTDAWGQIKLLTEKKKIDKQELAHLIAQYIIEAHKDHEYSYCVEAFDELLDFELLNNEQQPIRKDVWTATIESLIKINQELTSREERLIKIYQGIKIFHQEIAISSTSKRMMQISKRVFTWKDFCLKLNLNTTMDEESQLSKQITDICMGYFQNDTAKNLMHRLARDYEHLDQEEIKKTIGFIVNLINKAVVLKGKHSESILYLHVLLFHLSKFGEFKEMQAFLLLWVSSLSQNTLGIWGQEICSSKKDREVQLDQLLFELFRSPTIQETFLSRLWWYEGQSRDLQKLQSCYIKISQFDSPNDEDILNFRILFGSYFTLEECQSRLCKDITDKLLNNSEEEFL